jgi:hypothetical protein
MSSSLKKKSSIAPPGGAPLHRGWCRASKTVATIVALALPSLKQEVDQFCGPVLTVLRMPPYKPSPHIDIARYCRALYFQLAAT